MFREMIEKCAENVGRPPRRISFWDRLTYWRVEKPHWLKQYPDDNINVIFKNMVRMRRDGRVVWGHVIQAHHLLWEPGGADRIGEVVYSLGSPSITTEGLFKIACDIGSLKNSEPDDPVLAPLANYLTDERIRVFGMQVPSRVSPVHRCLVSTVFFFRKHFPESAQFLRNGFLPLLVNPEPPHVAMLLPSRYWPPEMVEWWCED